MDHARGSLSAELQEKLVTHHTRWTSGLVPQSTVPIMSAIDSFSLETPKWTAWVARLSVTAAIYVAGSLIAELAGAAGWTDKLFFLGLFLGFSAEGLIRRRYERNRRAILDKAAARHADRRAP